MFYPSKCQGFAPEATDDYFGRIDSWFAARHSRIESFEQLHLFRKIEKRSGGIPKNEIVPDGPRKCHSCVNSSPPELGNEITCGNVDKHWEDTRFKRAREFFVHLPTFGHTIHKGCRSDAFGSNTITWRMKVFEASWRIMACSHTHEQSHPIIRIWFHFQVG